MRFERRDAPGRTEFWVFDVSEALQPALEHIWADSRRGDGWRKSFESGAHQLDRAFANLQRLLEPALRQMAGIDPVPWPDALAEVCRRFGPAGVDWWLTGSAALAVRGAPVSPHDLDLIVAGDDSCRAGDLLLDCLIEPVARGEWHLSEWWGRAFPGARVEWAGGVTAAADEPEVTDFGFTAAAALESVAWRGWDIRVPPLELQRAVCLRRGLAERAAVIDRLISGS
jgi:hypothetical protein